MSDQPQPPHYVGTIFTAQDVRLDGATFERCEFGTDCRLVFSGEALPVLHECRVGQNVEIIFAGHAKLTAQFLSMLVHRADHGGLETFHRFLNDLYGGTFEPDPR